MSMLCRYFGGITRIIQCDNLKTGVTSHGKGVAFRTKREKFSYKIEKVRFCKNV